MFEFIVYTIGLLSVGYLIRCLYDYFKKKWRL